MRFRRFLTVVLWGLLSALLCNLLWWRWQVSQTRFFDVDEFSYLHWAGELVQGKRPYVDFFMSFTPGFLWFFAPVVKLYWMSAQVFLAARVVAYVIFLAIVACAGILFAQLRGRKWMIVPMVILVFLPMPYDKFLEIRPDNLMLLFCLIGVIGEIRAIRGRNMWWLFSGFAYGLAVLVFFKAVPIVAVGGIVAIWYAFVVKRWTSLIWFFAGIAAVAAILVIWMFTMGRVDLAWYSIVQLPFEATRVGKVDWMEPNLFFYPNPSFYGAWGITPALVINHVFWLVGICIGIVRLFTPFLVASGNKRSAFIEFFVAAVFMVSIFGYVTFFPQKHTQYLIPVSFFVAIYLADGISRLFDRLHGIVALAIVVGASMLFMHVTVAFVAPKLVTTNALQIEQMHKLIAMVGIKDSVLDIEGRMLFWSDAYYVCCVPFGSFVQYLTRKPDPLPQALAKTKPAYLYQGDTARFSQLSSADLAYINRYYAPVEGWGETLWKRISE